MSMFKKIYGTSVLADELNDILSETIENYENENSDHLITRVIPVTDNRLTDLDNKTEFEFEYQAGFFPEFTYRINEDMEVNYYNILIEEERVEREMTSLRKMFRVSEPVEEIEGDCFVKVNIKLEEDKVLQDKSILTSLIPEEYKSIFNGAKVNDVRDVEIRKAFTNEVDLAGLLEIDREEIDSLPETVQFTIVEISKEKPADLNQEFFDNISKIDSVHNEEEYREYVRNNIALSYEKSSLEQLYKDSVSILKEKANVTLPESFIKKYIRFSAKNDEEISKEAFESMMKLYIENTKWEYIENSLLKQADILITEDAVVDKAKELVRAKYSYGNVENPAIDSFADYYFQSEEGVSYVIRKIRIQKLAELIRDNAKLNIIDISVDDFNKLNQHEDTENQTQDVQEIQEIQDVQEIQEIQNVQEVQEVQEQNNEEQNNQE
jgi:trigger factor